MYNKNNRQFPKGFLLLEFITSFAVLTFFVLLFAQSFFYSISEYMHAKDRLHMLDIARNKVEEAWIGQKNSVNASEKLEIKRVFLPIVAPKVLPHTPMFAQEMVEVSWKDKKHRQKVQLSFGVVEK